MTVARRRYRKMLTGLFCLCVVLFFAGSAAGSKTFRTKPIANKGKKWRIGYYEGGAYINYPANLKAIAQGLVKLGWLERIRFDPPEEPTDSKVVWSKLADAKSDYLYFDKDAYSSSDWDEDLRRSNRARFLRRLAKGQLDLVIAMGTWAGQDLANNLHSVPTMVVSASDPVKSGIVSSADNSGYAHVHARCDPNRYLRQIRLFHDIIGFKRLGLAFEYSVVGRTYAAFDDIKQVAEKRGFELITCDAPWSGVPRSVRTQKLMECHQQLAPRIDALYVTVHSGVDLTRMDEILAPLMAYKIATWSQRGPEEVRHGVLMSIARSGFEAVGMYHAVIMARIFNGASPGELNQVFDDPKQIAINLETAKLIDFKPPKGLLKAADEIYK
jgi:ABC-type uncharacterized transport system substrate-binding protein